jgi:cation diffusion facilitator CzcD-associated flavoprotein CzcO
MPRNPLDSPLEHQQSLDDMRRKYRAERDKRLSVDRSDLLDLEGELAHYLDDPYLQAAARRPIRDDVDAVVVGAGFGGLLSGAYLRKAGVNRIRLIDRAGGVGGVWYWNRYPGAMCDVESYIYLPLLEEFGYIPSDKYALGADIRAHAEMIARRYRLDTDALLQTSVTGARWDEVLRRWEVSTDRGDVISTQFLVLANGALSKLKLPDLPGLETFQGHAFHTSRWDYSYTGGDARGDLTGLRDQVVGVVGTGASAVQCVPPLGRSAKHLYVFQRTPSTVAVRANRPTDPEWAQSLEPGWQYRRMVNFTTLVTGGHDDEDLVSDGWTDVYRDVLMSPKFAGLSPAEAAKAIEVADLAKMEGVRARVEQIVRDPATAEALKPYYRYLCKRPAFHDEFLDAFNYPNVTLVDTQGKGLERVYEHGVVANGVKFDLDGLIFATGFEFGTLYTHRIGFDLVGRDGLKLSDKWSPGMVSLHGVTTHGFPNLLVLPGPGSQSSISVNLVHALWENAAHIGYIVRRTLEEGHRTFEVTEAAENEWVQTLLASVRDISAYLADCTPGRRNNEGRPADRSRQNVDYGKGPIAFYKLLREWRDEGSLAGITFGDLTRAKRTFARNIAPPASVGPYVKRRTGPHVKRGFRLAGKRCILCPHVRLLFGIGMPWQVVLTSAMSNARRLST